jgi:hypothetical protein
MSSPAQMIVGQDTLFGNEWINYSQSYIKIKVSKTGFYRVQGSDLAQVLSQNGQSLSSINASQFALYHEGQEQAIYLSTTGTLSPSDYIEFWAKGNQGSIDKFLYKFANQHVNPYFSLFNDTAVYFLTWDNQANHKRISNQANDLSSPPSAEAYCWFEALRVNSNVLDQGKVYSGGLRRTAFDIGEGYTNSASNNLSQSIPTPNRYTSGPDCQVNMHVISSANDHDLSIEVGSTSYFSQVFTGYNMNVYNFAVPSSQLGASTTTVRVRGLLGSTDRHSTPFVKLTYPREFSFGGDSLISFSLSANPSARYIEFQNFDASTGNPWLYDLTNGYRLEVFWNAGVGRVLLPAPVAGNQALTRNLVLVRANYFQTSALQFVQFRNLATLNADYAIVTHPSLMLDGNGGAAVQDYADYRFQTGFNPAIIDIQELYDQFAYGIERHPLSIRNFTGFAVKNWSNPRYLFLIGKARAYSTARSGTPEDFFIPTFGLPESDILLAADNNRQTPRIPIGRLAVTNSDEVRAYLNKVIGIESYTTLPQSIEDRAWMKNVLHLGGGFPGFETTTIRSILEQMAALVENVQFGGRVFPFYKTSTDPIQVSQSDALDSLINNGVALITFFGHSSPNSFDYNLDRPENYNNTDRHPVMLSMGCYTGNIHIGGPSIARDFVLIPEKGAIAFIASSGLSTLSSLGVYGRRFYTELSGNSYTNGIGVMMQRTINTLGGSVGVDLENAITEMTLHGDPALRIYPQPGPDYLIGSQDYQVSPDLITTRLDSFELKLEISNIGSAVNDSFNVQIRRVFPDGSVSTLNNVPRMKAPYSRGTLLVNIPVGGNAALGLNLIQVTVDQDNEVAEVPSPAAESNNYLEIPIYILSDEVIPVYPSDFGIVGQAPTLKASTANVFEPIKEYIFEIDTTELFNSPALEQGNIIQAGGTLEWQPNISMIDSTVYYWRVSKRPAAGEAYDWRKRSFIYLAGIPDGWNQSHYFQYLYDRYQNMRLPQNRDFEFVSDVQAIDIENAYTSTVDYRRIAVYQNGFIINSLSGQCLNGQGLYVLVFDSLSLNPWENPPLTDSYGSFGCNSFQVAGFYFPTTDVNYRFNLIRFLQDSIPDNNYVLVYSLNDYQSELWDDDQANFGLSIFSTLGQYGASLIENTRNNPAPYAFFFKKNDPLFSPYEILGDSVNAVITGTFNIPGNWDEGNVKSTKIGPAMAWNQLKWAASQDQYLSDSLGVDVLGVQANGVETLLLQNIQVRDTSLTQVDAGQYPYLRLQFNARDTLRSTSPQLDYWRVLYEPLPDAAVRPEILFSFKSDTLQQSDSLKMSVKVENISTQDMDSLLVRYAVLNQPDLNYFKRYKALNVGDTLNASVAIPTGSLNGPQQFLVEINPNSDQPEEHFFNNLALRNFFVKGDRVNPLLDVTFDGVYIMDGDLVSAKPEIQVTLRDENTFLALNDTSDFQLYLKNPQGQTSRLFFTDPAMNFIPANNGDLSRQNKAMILYNPNTLEDGTYELIVNAQDRSGNSSGALSYRVSFKVINEASISNVLNYPNPFTTSTRFVFTLTGYELPDYMKIQIMTVSGKVVREITMDELGPIRIGHNLTDFEWDGTDMFGDRLANGVYLYRVTAKLNGSEYKLYNNNTSQYFEGGWGKMYLMR